MKKQDKLAVTRSRAMVTGGLVPAFNVNVNVRAATDVKFHELMTVADGVYMENMVKALSLEKIAGIELAIAEMTHLTEAQLHIIAPYFVAEIAELDQLKEGVHKSKAALEDAFRHAFTCRYFTEIGNFDFAGFESEMDTVKNRKEGVRDADMEMYHLPRHIAN